MYNPIVYFTSLSGTLQLLLMFFSYQMPVCDSSAISLRQENPKETLAEEVVKNTGSGGQQAQKPANLAPVINMLDTWGAETPFTQISNSAVGGSVLAVSCYLVHKSFSSSCSGLICSQYLLLRWEYWMWASGTGRKLYPKLTRRALNK